MHEIRQSAGGRSAAGNRFCSPVPAAQAPAAGCLSDAEKEQEQLEKTNENLKRQIMEFQEVQKQIRMLADYFRIRADKYEVLGNLPQTEHVFLSAVIFRKNTGLRWKRN